MDQTDFTKLLFKVAFCTIACDGHIDEREIQEMKDMDARATYFESIDLSEELARLIDDFHSKGHRVIEDLFSTLRETSINPIQELLVLEVALRLIYADDKHDENEIRFINILRSKLEISDETIRDRFGSLDILRLSEYTNNVSIMSIEKEFAQSVHIPEFDDLKDINFGDDDARS